MRHKMRLENRRIYNCWSGMKSRCFNKNNQDYKDYGGRGITICEEWLTFDNFCKWSLANGYKDSLTIDRINVNGNYEPTNCRWASIIEQANNKRRNHFIEYKGKKLTIAQWARELNVSPTVIQQRLKRNLPVEKVLCPQIKETKKLITYHNKTLSIRQWSKLTGLKEQTIGRRLKKGWSIEDALTTPSGEGLIKRCNNRKGNHLITFNGKTQSLMDWSRELGISNKTLSERLRHGWSIERSLTEPTHNKQGETRL